jgi:UDP-N-acetylmuramyl pentapeptide phosphotransferase/UDP-N-acetylglucosamine-1-phosphate transferase
MNREQKVALTTLITSLLGMTILIIATVFRPYIKDVPKSAIVLPTIVLAIAILVLVSRFKYEGAVKSDERDRKIRDKAVLTGFGMVFLLVILVSYLPIAIAPNAKIPTRWFPYLLPIAALCYCLGWSVSTLIQYGLGGKENE